LPLIVLNGPPQVGKSTLARALKVAGAQQVVLNRPFTKFVQDSLGLNNAEFDAGKDAILPEYDFKAPIRKALIAAADAVELVDPDVWVKRAFDYVSEDMQKRNIWVLDSVGKKSQMVWLQNNVCTPIILVTVGRPGVMGGGWLAGDVIVFQDPPMLNDWEWYPFSDGREDCRQIRPRPQDHHASFWNDMDFAAIDSFAAGLVDAAKKLGG